MRNELLLYFGGFFIVSLVFSIAIFGLLLRFVRTLGVRNLDELNMVRWTSQTKPSLGGLGFYIMFLLSFTALGILPIEGVDLLNRKLLGIFSACTLGFFIGLADDTYNTRPLLKFLGQLGCAGLLIAGGVFIPISGYTLVNYLFTALWVVGMMNSLNMLDNMDGITASVSVSALLGALVLTFSGAGDPVYAFVFYGVLAALVGFLWYNWHPSKMYMGDTGSMFLGVFMAAVAILLFWNNRRPTGELVQIRQFLIPLMAFLLPITDTTTVFIRRIAKGQSPFVGGKDHTTHQLAFLGVPDWGVSAIFSAVSLLGMGIGYWIFEQQDTWTYPQSLTVVIGYIVFFLAVQVVYQAGWRRHQQIALEREQAARTANSEQ